MGVLQVTTRDNRTIFHPGDEILGTVTWQLERNPQAVELRLLWHTRGRGATDLSIVETVRFDFPRPSDRRDFRFRAPLAPHSFSGRLVSIVWALELVALPSQATTRLDLTISPNTHS